MAAIKITQEIKTKNKKYGLSFVENNPIGTIVSTGFPRKFYVTEPVSGGYASRTDLHVLDGWKIPVVPVEYNSDTQKLGSLIEVGNDFVYQLINLTQDEIDIKEQNALDVDAAAQFFDQRKADGQIYLDRFNHYVYRQVVNGEITKAQAISGLQFFFDALHPLTVGYFELAITKTTALATGNASLITLKNKIITELQNYVDNE